MVVGDVAARFFSSRIVLEQRHFLRFLALLLLGRAVLLVNVAARFFASSWPETSGAKKKRSSNFRD
jgi:hypothetical protein